MCSIFVMFIQLDSTLKLGFEMDFLPVHSQNNTVYELSVFYYNADDLIWNIVF